MFSARRPANLSTCGLLTALALLCACGCSSPSGGGVFSRSDVIHELHLFVSPVGLQSSPSGPVDGLAVRVFASSRGHAKGVPIRSGTLDILAYDGAPDEAARRSVKPAQVWSFPATKLPPFAVTSSLGTGYELALPWQGTRPTASRLTIVARHTPASGPSLFAAPSIMPNALR